ncbi:MAG: PilZ domain-containing protein [Phycisphaerales bacterium JB059]
MSRFEALRKIASGELAENNGMRTKPRFVTTMVTCGAGTVVDISAGGLCVESKRSPGEPSDQVHSLTVQSPWGTCQLDVKIVWTKKIGRRRFETGLVFVDPDQAKALLRICWDPIDGPSKAA